MTTVDTLLVAAMDRLAKHRPIFHSEADFQLALAWQLQNDLPKADLRLEKRVIDDPRVELDILLKLDDRRYGLELKYPRSKLDIEVRDERFTLRTGAPDLDRYDVLRDVARLERLVAEGVVDQGCAVVLSNHAGLWQPAPRLTAASYDAFRLHDGRDVTGAVEWGPTAGEGTRTGRAHPIVLAGRYRLQWRDFSTVGTAAFRYLLIPVAGPAEEPGPIELLR